MFSNKNLAVLSFTEASIGNQASTQANIFQESNPIFTHHTPHLHDFNCLNKSRKPTTPHYHSILLTDKLLEFQRVDDPIQILFLPFREQLPPFYGINQNL